MLGQRRLRGRSTRHAQSAPVRRQPPLASIEERRSRRVRHQAAADRCVGTQERNALSKRGGPGRNRTGIRGFAVRCITTLPPDHWGRPKPKNRGSPPDRSPRCFLPGSSELIQFTRNSAALLSQDCPTEGQGGSPRRTPGARDDRHPHRPTSPHARWNAFSLIGRTAPETSRITRRSPPGPRLTRSGSRASINA